MKRWRDTRLRRAFRKLPKGVQARLRVRYRRLTAWPPGRLARVGGLLRKTPFDREYGATRGDPIDRYYINRFILRNSGIPGYATGVIQGRVLEIGEALYAQRFGNPGAVSSIDILDPSPHNPGATIIGDLTDPDALPGDSFDCIICTQTLLLIYDVRAAISNMHRALRPGGTLLVTVPGVSQICRPEMDVWGDYWRFTSLSVRKLFEEVFDAERLEVEAYGNVLVCSAFLYGLAQQDISTKELDATDPDYQFLISVKAQKADTPTGG